MALDTRIALGVQPVQQQPNMLAQYAQVMGIKAAQQEMQGNDELRAAYAQGGDLSDPAFRRRVMAANPKLGSQLVNQFSEMSSRDVKTQADSLKAIKDSIGIVNSPAEMAQFLKGAYSTPGGALLTKLAPYETAVANIPQDPKSFEEYKRKFSSSADRLFESEDARLSSRTSLTTAGIAANTAANRLNFDVGNRDYDRANPTQHFFTDNSGNLNRVPTRGDGSAAPVPMAGSGAPPPNITIGGGGLAPITGGTTPMAGGSSIMNPSSVNAFSPNSTNALLNPPQQTTGVNYAQVRQSPSPITNINAYAPASETAQAEFMKGSRTTFDQLKQASTVLDNIEKAKALIPSAQGFMGTGGETLLSAAKFLNNRLGTSISTEGIKSAEELNSRAFIGILDNLKKLDSQPSQQQQAALKQALGSLNTDPNAMSAVLDVFGDIVRSKVDIYNQEVKGAEDRGIKFPYNPVINLPPKGATASQPVYATNGKERIMSTDGGVNWTPAGAK